MVGVDGLWPRRVPPDRYCGAKVRGCQVSHVPDANLIRYRHLKGISRLFDSAGDNLGAQFAEDANIAYRLSAKYDKLAQELRFKPEDKP